VKKYTLPEVETLVKDELGTGLEWLLREGARKMLQSALEMEVSEYIERCQDQLEENSHRQVVRNGYHEPRELTTGIGKIPIRQPRVHNRQKGCQFTSAILPKYARRAPSIDTLIPTLYLKGISTSSFPEALEAILVKDAPGLSAANIVRLKTIWDEERKAWENRDLSDKHYAYIWVDGIYFNVRLEPDRPCMLVIIGATADGKKELVAIADGERESKLSWQNVLCDLKSRGLKNAPAIAVGDGGLGFWPALEEEFSTTKHQRCWVHKTANVLDKLPKRLHKDAKRHLHQMYLSPTQDDALEVYDRFLNLYQDKYPKACDCLVKDKDVLFTFYDFPAIHWQHLRTTNPIESTFATVRHRTRQTKGCGSRNATLAMVFKLGLEAQKTWTRLRGHKMVQLVLEGIKFVDGAILKAA
jgi:transposase-like protein